MEEGLPMAGFWVGAYADILHGSVTENVSVFILGLSRY